MIREDIPMPNNFAIVLLKDDDGLYIRILSTLEGRREFLTPKVAISQETIEKFCSWHDTPEPLRIGNFVLSASLDQISLKVPTYQEVLGDRKQWRIYAHRAFFQENRRA